MGIPIKPGTCLMRPDGALLTVLLVCAMVIASDANAGPPIESASFRLMLPDGWANDPQARPPAVKGPKAEIFRLSSTTAPAAYSAEEARPLIQEAERRALAIITRIEQSPSFQAFQPLSSEQPSDGTSFHYIVSMTKGGERLFAQYVVAGARTVLIATLDVPHTELAPVEDIASMLRNVQWRQ